LLSHSLFSSLSERIAAEISHRWQTEKAPPALTTTASIYEPIPSGSGVYGGVRALRRGM